jgi:hypothetical protein
VRDWAQERGYAYRFEEDELFERLPAAYRDKTVERPMVASDLARLLWSREVLREGASRVIWLDADVLVFDPARLELELEDGMALGREVWVQRDDRSGYRAFDKVHNALLAFERDNPLLDFWVHACRRLVDRWSGTPPPQLVGPRLLGVVHNLVELPVFGGVGSLSPHVLNDLVQGGGGALELQRARQPDPLAAANLCGSLAEQDYEGVLLDDELYSTVVRELLADGGARLR